MKALYLLAGLLVFGYQPAAAQTQMKFFVPSTVGPDASTERGIRAADQHCSLLGYAAGFGDLTWRAYLDAPATADQPAKSAKDRIGQGPWYNFHGGLIANSVEELLGAGHNLTRESVFNERGEPVLIGETGPTPHELLLTAKPDANGLYFCFAE